MKTVAMGVALLAAAILPALPAGPAANASMVCCGHYVRWAEHHDPADARLAITTEDGKVTLLLTDRDVAFQLSERTLHKVDRELRDKQDLEDNWLGAAIVTAVVGTVRDLVDNSLECRIRDLRDVSYEDGRLRFIARNGRPVFDDADVCDSDVTSAFSERDARTFVREFRKLKADQR